MRRFHLTLSAIALLLAACGSGADEATGPDDRGVPTTSSEPGGPSPTPGVTSVSSTGSMAPATATTGSLPGSPTAPGEEDLGLGEAPSGTSEPTGETAPPASTLFPSRCQGDASQTAMIGDSYLALTGEVALFLEGYAGQIYRHYYVSGTQLIGGLPPSIPDQARLAFGQGSVETMIMDGGGNDVLIGDFSCRITGPAPGSACEATVLGVADAVVALMDELAASGVREVIYFFYPYLPNNEGLNDTLDFGVPLVQAACEDAPALDCTFIDLRGPFDGHPEYIGLDGIHPTTPGSEVIAQLIWGVMQDNCANGVDVP